MLSITVEIDATGRVVAFTGMNGDSVVEQCWTSHEEEAIKSHTWGVSKDTYAVLRDVLGFIVKADWEEDQVI